MEANLLTIETRREDDRVVLVVQGEIDLQTVACLRQALTTACVDPPCNLLVDLSAADFFDASALRVLADTAQRLQDQGCYVLLDGLTPVQTKVVELGGLAKFLTFRAR